MKKIISYLLIGLITFFAFISSSFAIPLVENSSDFIYKCNGKNCTIEDGIEKTKDINKTGEQSGANYVSNVIKTVLGFLFFISVVIFIFAGVTVLISGGDEQKVEKAKRIMMYCVLGIVIIVLAYPIADFIINDIIVKSGNNSTNSGNP